MKVGTKVRVKRGEGVPVDFVGREGVITQVRNDNCSYPVEVELLVPRLAAFAVEELEVVEEKKEVTE